MAANVEFTNELRPALIRAKSKCLDKCVRSRDQKPYLHNETKVGTRIKTEFNSQNKVLLLQHDRRFFVYPSNMIALTSCEHPLLVSNIKKGGRGGYFSRWERRERKKGW